MAYLLGNPSDPANWGDSARTKGGQWAPLELVIAPIYRAKFMFMGIEEPDIDGKIVKVYLYKHDLTSEYVNVDADGDLYEYACPGYRRLELEEARSRLVGQLCRMLEEGLDINYDLQPALKKLREVTGLSIRDTNSE